MHKRQAGILDYVTLWSVDQMWFLFCISSWNQWQATSDPAALGDEWNGFWASWATTDLPRKKYHPVSPIAII